MLRIKSEILFSEIPQFTEMFEWSWLSWMNIYHIFENALIKYLFRLKLFS